MPECRVSGWAGGYRTAEPSRAKRIVETRSCDLTDGDVVLSVPKRGEDETCRIWAKSGDCLWERTKDGALRAVPEMEVTALLACDFFMAFRPAAEPDETARP